MAEDNVTGLHRPGTLESIEEIKRINASFPFTDPVRDWKKDGKKVIGWTCLNVPEEIIHAAGMLPFRVTGGTEEIAKDKAEVYFQSNTCSFIRSCLELGLRGDYDFLDGYVGSSPCEGAIRLAEVGKHALNIPHLYILDVPRKGNERSLEFYRAELEELKKQLEGFFSLEISEKAITHSIGLYNKTRASIRKLNELRKRDRPPISGAEMMEVLNAAVTIPRDMYNGLLEKLLSEIERTDRVLPGEIRVMISGSILNSPAFVKGIEDLGMIVVADDLCTGSRYWWEAVDDGPDVDPLSALTRRYLNMECACPRMNSPVNRTQWLLDRVREYNIHAVIALTMRNCAPYIHDLPLWKDELAESGVPVLDLDIEYGTELTGQILVRAEAFMEMLSWDKEFG